MEVLLRDNDRISTALTKKKEKGKRRCWGAEGLRKWDSYRGSVHVSGECGFLVTVEPASMWPLPRWRQYPGKRADGWLAGVSAPLWSSTGILCPFVSIRRRKVQKRLFCMSSPPLAGFPPLIDRWLSSQTDVKSLQITFIPMQFIYSIFLQPRDLNILPYCKSN